MTLTLILEFGNLVLASANVIIGFSLLAYIIAHNVRNEVGRAYCALLAFVTAVYIVDVALTEVSTAHAAGNWLRAQWLGIAFVPAAYLHFSDALLRTTGAMSRWRRRQVLGAYLIGMVSLFLAAFTDLLVQDAIQVDGLYHLQPGPYFWLFAVYYIFTSIGGWARITLARRRCLTSTSRRRMSYLMLAFVAPAAGVFPYLLVPTTAQFLPSTTIHALTLLGNLGIGLMTIVIGYIVAYQGVLLPDRVIKHDLLHYLLRGPLVSILVIVLMLVIPRVESILGLPRETILIVSVAGSLVILQLLVDLAKPAIDRLVYRRDRRELLWIQTLSERLLTTTDLEQVLENTLIGLCDLLRAPAGFIVTMQGATLSIKVFCGPREAAIEFLNHAAMPTVLDSLTDSRRDEFISNGDFVRADGHWLLPLRDRTDQATLGILGISASGPYADYDNQDLANLYDLVHRAELALEDIRLQQRIFGLLQGLGDEIDRIQEWRSQPIYSSESQMLQHLELNPVHSAGFVQTVRDALGQYWGGPRLSQSPLRHMRIVEERLGANDNVPAKAIRAVLQEAIERLRPTGERSATASEWVIYNILDFKYVQGQRIRDITRRMAMSDSDYYRKQRVAIEQVAETLTQMEQSVQAHQAEVAQSPAPHPETSADGVS